MVIRTLTWGHNHHLKEKQWQGGICSPTEHIIITSPLCVSFIGTDKAFKPLSRMLLPFQRTLRITKEISRSIWGTLGPYDLCDWLLFYKKRTWSLPPQSSWLGGRERPWSNNECIITNWDECSGGEERVWGELSTGGVGFGLRAGREKSRTEVPCGWSQENGGGRTWEGARVSDTQTHWAL